MNKTFVNIVLTGAVGVGKTTLCEAIRQYYLDNASDIKIEYIPEYLAHPQGLTLLNEYLTKKITNITFQNFIMDYYEQTLMKINDDENTTVIRIFERTPDDSLLLFANLANLNDEFDDLGLLNLYERVKYLNEKYSIPSVLLMNTRITQITTNSLVKNIEDIKEIIDIEITINSPYKNRIIFLFNDSDTVEKRIRARDRSGESVYDKKTIDMFCNYYERIYKYLSMKSSIRFVDIGRFLNKSVNKIISDSTNVSTNDLYKIALVGPVSVGKTTLSLAIRDKYNCLRITECNETTLGSTMLTSYLNGYISDITFQEFIHDHYNIVHKIIDTYQNSMVVYDGLPDIGITCFSNVANKNNKLSNPDYLRITDKIKRLNIKYGIPSILLNNSEYSYLTTDDVAANLQFISDIIESDTKNGTSNRIIFLNNTIPVLSKRINTRGRDGEEKYTDSNDKMITQFYEHFEKLQEWCKNNYKLRFVDIGELIS